MARILSGGILVPDVGDVVTWDGARWIPAAPQLIPAPPQLISGPPGPRGPGGGHGSVGASGPAGPPGPAGPSAPLVTPFRLIPVPATTTNSLAFVDLMTAPGGVSVVGPGDVLLDFDASMQVSIPNGPGPITTFQIVAVQFLWDGAPLIDTAFAGIVPLQADIFSTIVYDLRVRSLVIAPAIGIHTLAVQWNVADATCFAECFANNGNLSVQSV